MSCLPMLIVVQEIVSEVGEEAPAQRQPKGTPKSKFG